MTPTSSPNRSVASFLTLAFVSSLVVSCGDDSSVGLSASEPCVSWCKTPAPWPHDGQPLESENFIVYSDGASVEARMTLASIAEEVLAKLKTMFEISDNAIFVLPPEQTKFHLFTFKHHNPQEWGGQAYWGGFIVYSMDHPQRSAAGLTAPESYSRLVKHELTHVIQGVLVGSEATYSVHTWFEEGIAELVSNLNPDRTIASLSDLNDRISRYGELNPIAITNDVLPDIEGIGVEYFYPMYELSLRYLLDERGLDRSPIDVRDVFLDMRDGMGFTTAFEGRFGISASNFEAEYFDRIRAYLD